MGLARWMVRPSVLVAVVGTATVASTSRQPSFWLDFPASLKPCSTYPVSQVAQSFTSLFPKQRQRQSSKVASTAAFTSASLSMVSMEEVVQESDKVQTEFMVDMECEGCVRSIRSKLENLEGVSSVHVDLPNQVVKVVGTLSIKAMTEALEKTGRHARLIGQGRKEEFAVSAAVAEFKGPQVHGIVRFAQINMEKVRVEASLSGLSPGFHGWSVNEYGDLTSGAASTGAIFHPKGIKAAEEPLGDLGILEVDGTGRVDFIGTKSFLNVGDLIGRALVIYATEDKNEHGICAAVIARSAGVGENYKKLCTCDGTIIWEASNNDFVKT